MVNPLVIDDSTRRDHYYLEPEDRCYYYGNYTPSSHTSGPVWEHSPTNQLICNLKKRPGTKGQNHKAQAIEQIAAQLRLLPSLQRFIIVPVPPSKARTHAQYDDRIVRILSRLQALRPEIRFRELIVQTQTLDPFHGQDSRLPPNQLLQHYQIETGGLPPPPPDSRFIVFDDVMTTGSHFKAMQSTLRNLCPESQIIGLFVARREIPEPDFSDIFP